MIADDIEKLGRLDQALAVSEGHRAHLHKDQIRLYRSETRVAHRQAYSVLPEQREFDDRLRVQPMLNLDLQSGNLNMLWYLHCRLDHQPDPSLQLKSLPQP